MEKGKKTPKNKKLRYRYLIRDVTILSMLAIMSIMVPMSIAFLVMYLTNRWLDLSCMKVIYKIIYEYDVVYSSRSVSC